MRQTEITVQVYNELPTIFKRLEEKGYKLKGKYTINDFYYTSLEINKKQKYDVLIKNSFLINEAITDKYSLSLVYKDKEIDKAGNVISEEKIRVSLGNLADALKIFEKANIHKWCEISQDVYEYSNGKYCLLVQHEEEIGNFIEFEEDESMKDMTTEEKINFMHSILKELDLKLGDDTNCKKVYMKYLLHQPSKN